MIGTSYLEESCPQSDWTGLSDRSTLFLAVLLFPLISAFDLALPNINCSVMFSVPLVLLVGRAVRVRYLWWYVAVLIAAIYVLYFVKYLVVFTNEPLPVLGYRLFNRSFAALSIALIGVATQAWLYWQHERSLLTYLDRADEDEVNSTAGLVGCVGLGLLIAAIDFVSPANFNLPILFAVPLYLVSWLHHRISIWIASSTFIALTWFGYFVTPPATVPGLELTYIVNRIVVTGSLILLALILSYQLRIRPLSQPTTY